MPGLMATGTECVKDKDATIGRPFSMSDTFAVIVVA